MRSLWPEKGRLVCAGSQIWWIQEIPLNTQWGNCPTRARAQVCREKKSIFFTWSDFFHSNRNSKFHFWSQKVQTDQACLTRVNLTSSLSSALEVAPVPCTYWGPPLWLQGSSLRFSCCTAPQLLPRLAHCSDYSTYHILPPNWGFNVISHFNFLLPRLLYHDGLSSQTVSQNQLFFQEPNKQATSRQKEWGFTMQCAFHHWIQYVQDTWVWVKSNNHNCSL